MFEVTTQVPTATREKTEARFPSWASDGSHSQKLTACDF